ncbi:MAG: PF20097 family protein [Candidatus Bathyarchaeia archaeon]
MSLQLIGVPIIVLLILLVVTRLRLSRRPRDDSTRTGEGWRREVETLRECPSCGGSMEEGYLIGPSGIYWSKSSRVFGPFVRDLGIAEPLGVSSLLRGMRRQCFRAYRCQRCGIIHVNLDEEQFPGF